MNGLFRHDGITRNKESLHIPLCNTVSGQRSFRFRAVKLWNTQDNELNQLPSGTFKKKIKANMIDHSDHKMIHFKLLLSCKCLYLI